MATAKMKPSTAERMQHLVIIDVDGAVDEVLAATAADAERIAASVVDAAAGLTTVVIPVGEYTAGNVVVVGQLVLDLAKAKRTAVRVESRSQQLAAMGIKK